MIAYINTAVVSLTLQMRMDHTVSSDAVLQTRHPFQLGYILK